MTDTYTLHYETPEKEVTLSNLPLLVVVHTLLWLQQEQTLTHDDFLEILDDQGEHVHNAIDYIDARVEFEVIDQNDVYSSDFVNALYSIDFNLTVSYRLRDTQEWTIYYND